MPVNLKVKYHSASIAVPNAEKITFADFKQIVAAQFGLDNTDFALMHGNRVDEINLQSEMTMDQAGLVSGDIVYVRDSSQLDSNMVPMESETPIKGSSSSFEKPKISDSLDPSNIRLAILRLIGQNYQDDTGHHVQPSPIRYDGFRFYTGAGENRFNIDIDVLFYYDDPLNHNLVTMVQLTTTVLYHNVRRIVAQIWLHQGIRVQPYFEQNLLRPIQSIIQGWENENNPFLRTIMNPRLIDVTSIVLHHLRPRDVIRLESACSVAMRTCQTREIDSDIWKRFVQERFGDEAVNEVIRLRESFRSTYMLRARLAREAAENRQRLLEAERRRIHPYWPWPRQPDSQPSGNDPRIPEPYGPLNPLLNLRPWNPDADINPLAGGPYGGMVQPRNPYAPYHGPRIFPFVPGPGSQPRPDPDAPELLAPRLREPNPDVPQMRPFMPPRRPGGQGGHPFGFDPSRFI